MWPHLVDRHDEVETGEDAGEPEYEHTDQRRDHCRPRLRAVGCIEGPTCIKPTGEEYIDEENRPDHPEVKGTQIQSRECDVLGSQQQRQHEVAERRWHPRDDHQEHHDGPMSGEPFIVEIRLSLGSIGEQRCDQSQR